MVADAPPIESALPAFLEFAAGCVLVAHNAPVRRRLPQALRRASRGGRGRRSRCSTPPRLARRVITRDDAPNCKLSSLARVFRSATTPNHRALADARATVDVLHGLMERLGGLGVHTLEELQTFSSRVTAAQRRKRHLAEGLPHAPGVYLFRDDRSRVLYVGTSRDLRSRVRSYFTASETRSRMGEMVRLAASVDRHRVRDPARGRGARAAADRRAQAALQPPLAVPGEGALRQAHPRAVAAAVAGPAGARRRRRLPRPVRVPQGRREVPGRAARDVPGPAVLRPARPADRRGSACVLAEMGRCLSPCDGSVDADDLRRRRTPAPRRRCCAAPTTWSSAINARMAALAARRAVRGGRRPPRPAGGVRPRRRAHPAAHRADPLPRGGRRPARGRRPLGGPRRPPRPARRRRRDPARRRRPACTSTSCGPRAETVAPARARCRRPPPRRPSGSCAGWRLAGVRLVEIDGEWTCPVGGATRHLRAARRRRAHAGASRSTAAAACHLLRSAP